MMNKKAKEPLYALLLSVLAPGLGQVYAGERKRGIIIFFLVISLNLGISVCFLHPGVRVGVHCLIMALLSFSLSLFSWFNAYFLTRKYNLAQRLDGSVTRSRRAVLIVEIACVALLYYVVAPLYIQSNLYRFYAAPPNSMEPAVYQGEQVLVNLAAYKKSGPRRGDVVVYRCPDNPAEIYLHRVVGLPGETILIKDRKVFINGLKLTSAWALKISHYNGGKLARRGMKPVTIPPGAYYVLGDSAARSRDSRYWGFLPSGYLLGKAEKICYPFARSGRIE